MATYKVESYDPGMKYSDHFRKKMAKFIDIDLNVRTVLELGCGPGRFLAHHIGHVDEILGIDGCDILEADLHIPKDKFLMMDITDKDMLLDAVRARLGEHVDCLISLETLEHISPEHDHTFFEIIESISPEWVVLSIARPGQAPMPGESHPNCQEVDEVISKMAAIGYDVSFDASDALRSMMLAPTKLLIDRPWADFYQRNTRVYVRA